MLELLHLAECAAATNAKVLITGESGAGKDVIARHIHQSSPRRRAPYVPVNCAAVAELLLESELFGHVKGSFTGAYRDKAGKLRAAHGGTLFLDEVSEMSLRMQALMLRFLENGEIQAVGADGTPSIVDVRVIAATNKNLGELVRAGQFREDLWYRLRVIHLHVPPLREHRADIRPLATRFFTKSARRVMLTEEAWLALESYRWPGNVRQLQNVVEQIVCLSVTDDPVEVAQLPQTIRTTGPAILPLRERRRQVADELFQALVNEGYSFWDHIQPLLMSRDITRHDIRELVRRALSVSRGSYRGLLQLFGLPPSHYKRFMNFLTTHNCQTDFREFRNARAELSRSPRSALVCLPPLVEPRATGDQRPNPPSGKRIGS
jgi:transcriptional regulator with PAS, ATPase and Fis domain